MVATAIAGPARVVPRPSLQTVSVLALIAGLAALTGILGRTLLADPPLLDSPLLPWWILAPAFAATELIVLHIQVRREAQTVSVSELPLVLGLFFAAPIALVVGRFLGSAAVLVLHRRSSPLKTLFNLALVTAETTVAVWVFRLVAAADVPLPVDWLAAYGGVLLANAVSIVTIGLVIAVYEGGLHPRALLRDAVLGHPAGLMVVTVSLVAVTSLSAEAHSTWLLLPTGIGLLFAFRAYATLNDRHLNLERLYRFSQAVSRAPELDEVLGSVLAEARELLKAERAEVVFVAAPDRDVAHVRLGADGRLTRSEEPRTAVDGWLLERVVRDGDSLVMPRTARAREARAWLDAQLAREALAVPLRGSAGIIGALVVADRLGDVRTFDAEDVLLLETVANHAGIAMQNGELIDRLRHEALHDALTGLPNRSFLQRRLAVAVDDIGAGRSAGAAVMILDLDGFKEVNDTLGHQKGDLLLAEVATRLVASVGTEGTVVRLGGDEFAVLLTGTADQERAVAVGLRALSALEQPVDLDGLAVAVSGSLGIALAPAHATEPAGLLKRADLAMYDAKGSSRGLRVYEKHLDDEDPFRLTLVAELRGALQDGDGVEVHFQPQARPADGTVTGVEALARWTHPVLGVVTPDVFVPVAERSGLIGALTTRVLDRSLAACADWAARGHELGVAVNLSARSLLDADLVDEVSRLLQRHRVPAARLTLEVTEGSVMADPDRAIAVLQSLRDLGVRVSVDDFGTGYSSLSYLKRLPIHEVKIDRSFVTGLAEGGEDAAIVRAVVDLAQHLHLEVVAEGVEDQETWDILASLGCDLVQGWHLGRPVPAERLLPWLEERSGKR